MNRKVFFTYLLCLALLLNGCALLTVEEMYYPPKRSEEYSRLQTAIDKAMAGLEYSAPISGENQQTVQMADLNGDGVNEYILFARGSSEKPLQILIFTQYGEEFQLTARIESNGFAFEQVECVPVDDRPGYELVVGRQVSDQVLRSVSVYSFANGEPTQILSDNYARFLTCDLDQNGRIELMLIKSELDKADNAFAVRYWFQEGSMARSREAELSGPADSIKRIMPSRLYNGEPAVYVATAVAESAIITDIFAMKDGKFTNISFSNEVGTSVKTLRNYYVYAEDIDNDGTLELPSLITMKPCGEHRQTQQQYLIRWFAMDLDGNEVDKGFTYHNYHNGWYLNLDSAWANRISVEQKGICHVFYVWDEAYEKSEMILTIYALTGADREVAALEEGRFVLHRAEGVVYAARLETSASFSMTQQELIHNFHMIHQDWKTGET